MADKPDASDQSPAEAGQPRSAGNQPTEELPATPTQPTQELPGPSQAGDQPPQEGEPSPAGDQTAQSGTEAPPPPPPVVPPAAAAKRPPHMTRTWIAAAVAAALLLLGGGVAGYAIGSAGGHDHRPGYSDRRGPGGDMHWRDGRDGDRPGARDGDFGDR